MPPEAVGVGGSHWRTLYCPRSAPDEASKDSLIDLLISEEEQLRIPAVLLAARKRLRKAATWDSWEMTELRGIPAKDVAAKLGIPVANVYVNRQRVAELIETVGRELIGES